jgi:hypothetical protein
MKKLKKNVRITGADRDKLAADLRKKYEKVRPFEGWPSRRGARTGSRTASSKNPA